MRYVGAFMLLAGTAAVAGVAMAGSWNRLATAVMVLAVAGCCVLALRLLIAQAAGSLAASQEPRRGGDDDRHRAAEGEREGGFNPTSPENHPHDPETSRENGGPTGSA